jgi:hypothetical protein
VIDIGTAVTLGGTVATTLATGVQAFVAFLEYIRKPGAARSIPPKIKRRLAISGAVAAGFLLGFIGFAFLGKKGPQPNPPSPSPQPSAPAPASPTPAPAGTQPSSVAADCPKGTKTVVLIPSGGTDFNIQIEVCTPPPSGHHYWLMAVLHNQGATRTTNYYPLSDVAALPTTPGPHGQQLPTFGSTVTAVSSGRCWEVLIAPDSMQTDLTNLSNADPRQSLYTHGSRPPTGLVAASTCVPEPE